MCSVSSPGSSITVSGRSVRRARKSAYQTGNQLFARERYDEAIEQFRIALSISHKFDYRLALGLALAKVDRPAEALIYLEEARAESPANALANLAVAGVEAQSGSLDRAIAHYQRAIYGTWPPGAESNRIRARVELADALARAGKQQQAAGELLSLAADRADDPAFLPQMAQRLSALGYHDKAADVYRQLVKRAPDDSTVLRRLGEEVFALGDFNAACSLHSGMPAISRESPSAIRSSPSTPPASGLPAAERYRRSQALVAAVQDDFNACTGAPATALRGQRRKPPSLSDAAEANLALAAELWAKRLATCASPPPPGAALTSVMSMMKSYALTRR